MGPSIDREKVIETLQYMISEDCTETQFDYIDEIEAAIAMLKEQEESIPVSWLKEKLVGHPELPYATTDGIIDILNMWGRR